jgi:NTP pyrophosphatase (non-canonical NTP hydrolase)
MTGNAAGDPWGTLTAAVERLRRAEAAEPHADAGAEAGYASDLVALAARDLVRRIERGQEYRPAGWDDGGDPPDGHKLARLLIAKHGVDRYPTVHAQLLKVLGELGELAEAVLKGLDPAKVAKEYADTGLGLFELGNKLGIDLEDAMRHVVDTETRTFGAEAAR